MTGDGMVVHGRRTERTRSLVVVVEERRLGDAFLGIYSPSERGVGLCGVQAEKTMPSYVA